MSNGTWGGLSGPAIVDIKTLDGKELDMRYQWAIDYAAMRERRRKSYEKLERVYGGHEWRR